MPPKATSRSRNSQGQAPELISIYGTFELIQKSSLTRNKTMRLKTFLRKLNYYRNMTYRMCKEVILSLS